MAAGGSSGTPQRQTISVPGYTILEPLGRGGMGVVYKARQDAMERTVALKVLFPKLAADPKFMERFIREARASAKLNHPNIVQGIDVGQAGPTAFFAMEYVDGPTLRKLVQEKGALDWREAAKIAIQIGMALEHARSIGMVHRDVKPDNILVTSRGDAKLVDLGLARQVVSDEDNPELTQAGKAVGTPHYIAPEQARGLPNIDIRADIYSLGATLYAALTGHPMFQAQTGMQAMVAHLTEKAPSPRDDDPEVPEPLVRVLAMMLARSPDDRYQTPAAMVKELEAVLADRPTPLAKAFKAECSLGATVVERPRIPTGGPVSAVKRRAPAALSSRAGSPAIFIAGGVAVLVAVAGLLAATRSPATPKAKKTEDPPARPAKTTAPEPPKADPAAERAKAAATALEAALKETGESDPCAKLRRLHALGQTVAGTPSEARWSDAMAASREAVEKLLAAQPDYPALLALREKFAEPPLLSLWEKAVAEAERKALADWETIRRDAAKKAEAGDFAGARAAVRPFAESPVGAVAEAAGKELERLAALEKDSADRERKLAEEAREKGQRFRYEMYEALLNSTDGLDMAAARQTLAAWQGKPEMNPFLDEMSRIAGEFKWLDDQTVRACTQLVTGGATVQFTLKRQIQKGKITYGKGDDLTIAVAGPGGAAGPVYHVPLGMVGLADVMAALGWAAPGQEPSLDAARFLFWRKQLQEAKARLSPPGRDDKEKELIERIAFVLGGAVRFVKPECPRGLRASVPKDKGRPDGKPVDGVKDVPADIAWEAGSPNALKFRIERRDVRGPFAPVGETASDARKFRDAKVPVQAQVTYRVIAINDAGESDPSPEFTLVTPAR